MPASALDRPVLFCECADTDNIAVETRRRVREALAACDRPVMIVPDLCGMAAVRDSRLAAFADAGGATILACYPRAVQGLFRWAGHPLVPERIQWLNLRVDALETVVAALRTGAGHRGSSLGPASGDASGSGSIRGLETAAPGTPHGTAPPPGWRPWFPVIDADRCTQCRQCLAFCLFGVYQADADGRVQVTHPAQCKDACPACARMCPAMAIMFPKIEEQSPVSGSLASAAQAAGKVCLSRERLFRGQDTLDALRARRQRPSLLNRHLRTKPDGHDFPVDRAPARRNG